MSRPTQRRGFSLVEVLVATTLASFAMVGVMSCFIALQRSHVAAVDSMVETNRFILVQDQLGVDLRNAVAVTQLSSTVFAVRVRLYDDGPADDTVVTYAFDPAAGTLSRNANGYTQVLMRNLTDAGFVYFRRSADGTRQQTTAAAEVNAVRVTLTPSNQRVGGAAQAQTLLSSSLIQLRRISFP